MSNFPLSASTKYPLVDGQKLIRADGLTDTVGGEIKPEHSAPVCWTIAGNWYRRRDGKQVSVSPLTGKVVPLRVVFRHLALKRRKEQR